MSARMSTLAVRRAATLLFEARRDHAAMVALPEDCRPKDLEEAYRIQDALAELIARPVVGWKVGFTSAEARARRKVTGPISGRIFEGDLHASPARPRGVPPMLCLEAELAFRMRKTLQARDRAFTRDEVADSIDVMIPALELCVSHFLDWRVTDIASVIADNSVDIGLVLGSPVADWRSLDLATIGVRVLVDGSEISAGSGAQVMGGDPIESIVFLANHLAARGTCIEAEQVITTGTMHGAPSAPPRSLCVADFGKFGAISVQFSG